MGLDRTYSSSNNSLSIINTVRKLANSYKCSPIANIDQVLQILLDGKIELQGLMPWSSNYTFLASLVSDVNQENQMGVYKPCAGERPLWDFPEGTLCHREFVTYVVSLVLGWPNIPPTVLRDGPHGLGSVQLFIEADYEAHYFNMRDSSGFTKELSQIALFDVVVNNADRKGGHCLKDKNGHIWAIDHGLTFHTDFKLRTVIWEFCQDLIADKLIDDLRRLQQLIVEASELWQILVRFISAREIQALKKRIDFLLSSGRFPDLHPGRNVPYPPI